VRLQHDGELLTNRDDGATQPAVIRQRVHAWLGDVGVCVQAHVPLTTVHEQPTAVVGVRRAQTSDSVRVENFARKCGRRASTFVDFWQWLSCFFDCAHYDLDRSSRIAF
jgi:hypothetical protein